MDDRPAGQRYAGLWVRLAAVVLDAAITLYSLQLAIAVLGWLGIYIPRELTFLLVTIVYATILVGRRGATLGKALLGLSVRTRAGSDPGYLRAFLRESVGKLVSTVFLLLGFLWIGLSRRKRGWHDLLTGTVVLRAHRPSGPARLVSVLLFGSVILPLASRWASVLYRVHDASRIARVAPVAAGAKLDRQQTIDVGGLSPRDYVSFVRWLDANGKDPVEYAIGAASQHQVTIFGERHRVREDLQFLNGIIPDLYHRAKVTCIAMEVCVAEDNAKLARLVTSDQFDQRLAMEIARDDAWAAWGYREYWDVFHRVWQLNQSLPAGARKMRVIGIDRRWDGPSVTLAGFGDGAVPGPAWERLRLFRVLDDLPLLTERDAIMARAIERQAFVEGDRTVVWVGSAHSLTTYRIRGGARMGSMLYDKYGDRVFQIRLHDSDGFTPGIVRAVERAMALRRNAPVGFGVPASPFDRVRERLDIPGPPEEATFSDMAQGYVFLTPLSERTRCRWQDGYVSPQMFIRAKPYYEAEAGRGLSNSEEANQVLASTLAGKEL